VDSLRRAMNAVSVGQTGYVWLMFGQDQQRRDIYLFNQEDLPDAVPIDRVRDAEGMAYLDQIREDAIRLEPGEVEVRNVIWEDVTGALHRKELHYTYFAPWDWVVGVTAFEEEFEKPHQEVQRAFAVILTWTLVGAIITLIFVGILATFLGGLIARPIT
ncbi:MAG: Cache 3/Cache 2 fusion domain-containing protein, partial [Verrucomicrobiota bacterium]